MKHDSDTIIAIAQRASDHLATLNFEYSVMDCYMDIVNAHKQVPLMLADLLEADDSNFYHDVLGIRRHINRKTCKLEGCFMPRYAAVYHIERGVSHAEI